MVVTLWLSLLIHELCMHFLFGKCSIYIIYETKIVKCADQNCLGMNLFGEIHLVVLNFIGKLKGLKDLDVCNNSLQSFPSAVLRLQRLQRLNLSANPIGSIPSKRLGMGLAKGWSESA